MGTKEMKSVILYPYGPLTATGCCRMLHARNLALTSAIYTINISILIVLIYSWRINVNVDKSGELEDVYYGVQVAYFAIIGTQISMILLSTMLIFGIFKENPGMIVPWIIGYITFMALEAVAMVYSNVLRDHVNKDLTDAFLLVFLLFHLQQFDAMCKAEVAFFITRAFINVLSMWGVLRFYNLVRSGITWHGTEAKTSLTPESPCAQHHQLTAYQKSTSNEHQKYNQVNLYTSKRSRGKRSRRLLSEEPPERQTVGCCFFDFIDFDDGDYHDNYDEELYVDDDDDIHGDLDDDYNEKAAAGTGRVEGGFHADDEKDSSDCSMLDSSSTNTSSFMSPCTRISLMKHPCASQRSRSANNNNIRTVLITKRHLRFKIAQPQSRLEVINESERSAGSGSDENDSLLVAFDSSSSLASV